MTAMKLTALERGRCTPKVKRASPVIGSRPTVREVRPKRPARMPLSIDFDEMLIMIVRPKTTRANISAGPK